MTVTMVLKRMTICITALGLAACVTTHEVSSPFSSNAHVRPHPKLAAQYNVQLGIAYMRRGDLQFAESKLDLALKENPRNPTVHGTLALLYERLGEPRQADREFREALRLAPDDPDISNNYGVFLCRTNRVARGVKRLIATARNPLYKTPEVAYTNASVCLLGVRRDGEAKRYLELALAQNPGFAQAAYELAYLEMRQGDLRDARAEIDHYLNTYTETPALLALGVQIARKERDPKAEEHYKQRLRVDFPNSPETRALSASEPDPG